MAYITKGIGGFYYVKTPDGIVECKARGIFRKRGITPVAGDNVTLSDDGTMIDEILPRKNVFIRPPIANLDILFIVTSTTQPVPSTLVLDQLAAAAIYKDVQPVLVVTKSDLAAADMLRTAYAGSGIPLVQLNYETGEGLDEVKGYIEGHLCAFCGNSGVGKSTLLNTLAPRCTARPGRSAKSWAAGGTRPARSKFLRFAEGVWLIRRALPAWRRRSSAASRRMICSTPSRSSDPISGSAALRAAPTAVRPVVLCVRLSRPGPSAKRAMQATLPCMRKPAHGRSGRNEQACRDSFRRAGFHRTVPLCAAR